MGAVVGVRDPGGDWMSTAHPDHFTVVDDTAIGPQPWMQLRPVATSTAPSVSKSYDPSGGGNKDEPVHAVQTSWTNTTPINQWVYGMVTRDGASVTLQARSRGYLVMRHGYEINADGLNIAMTEVSRHGTGIDIGKAGVLAAGTGFGVARFHMHSGTAPFMPHRTGMWLLEPGDTFHARVDLRFKTEYWETTVIDGGDEGSESGFISGDTQIDLYALPAFVEATPRPVPSLVGAVRYDTALSGDTEVGVPAHVAEGDVLVAVVANTIGLASEMGPVESGWTQLLSVNDGILGIGDVHMKIYMRPASDDEPATYSFTNGLFAQEIAVIVAVRDAAVNVDEGWHAASALRKQFWERDAGHIAPSIDRAGQLLLAVSFVAKLPLQGAIAHTPPAGMTEIADLRRAACSMGIAYLAGPPTPTGARAFTLSRNPRWDGRSITAAVLIPGAFG